MTLPRKVAIGAGILFVLSLLAVGVFLATFDANRYKPQVIGFVKDRYDRTLTIDGALALALFPRIGLSVSGISLSERRSDQPFAKVAQARVAVSLLPLLARRVVVERVELAGLDVVLVRRPDGSTNADDLLGRSPAVASHPPPTDSGSAPADRQVAIDIAGITLRDASVGWRDEGAGTDLRLSKLALETGRIADGVPGRVTFDAHVLGRSPKLEATLAARSGYRFEFSPPRVHLDDLDLSVRGDFPGIEALDATLTGSVAWAGGNRLDLHRLQLNAKAREALAVAMTLPKVSLSPEHFESAAMDARFSLASQERRVEATLALPPIKGDGQRIAIPELALQVDAKQKNLTIQGKVTSPLVVEVKAGTIDLTKLVADLEVRGPAIPEKARQVGLQGNVAVNWIKRTADAALTARFDESTAQLKLALADLAKPSPTFDLVVDRFDADRYASSGATPAAQATTGPAGAAVDQRPVPDKTIDLSALRAIDASGSVRVGELTVSGVSLSALAARLSAADGRIDVNPLTARLYDGTMAGAVAIDAGANRYTIRQRLENVSVGPLLRDAVRRDVLDGRGAVVIDVAGAGTTLTAIKRSLHGTASLDLRDGALKGINLAEIARRARALRGGNLEGATATQTEKTDFSALHATFSIRDGVAHNEDLDVKSPFLRIAGAGNVDIGEGTLDYLAKASVVGTTTGQDGKTLDQARGITVPVRLTGPLAQMKYSVDVGTLARDAATDEVKRRVGERVDRALGERGRGALGDALKGILGR